MGELKMRKVSISLNTKNSEKVKQSEADRFFEASIMQALKRRQKELKPEVFKSESREKTKT